jgi:hypothetical protein
MRTVVRNSFARHTVMSEQIHTTHETCAECGQVRYRRSAHGLLKPYLYRFHVDDDQGGSRRSGPVGNGKMFCCRSCAEAYIGQPFDETQS